MTNDPIRKAAAVLKPGEGPTPVYVDDVTLIVRPDGSARFAFFTVGDCGSPDAPALASIPGPRLVMNPALAIEMAKMVMRRFGEDGPPLANDNRRLN
jgi:hypothetical protein